MSPLPTIALMTMLLTAACAGADTGSGTGSGTIRGVVVLGPACPVEAEPAPNGRAGPAAPGGCARPGIESTVEVVPAGATTAITTTTTGADGSFSVAVPVGLHTLRAVPLVRSRGEGVPVDVNVARDELVEVNLTVDTGVR